MARTKADPFSTRRAMRAPYVASSGDAEYTSLGVPTAALHVRERIEPRRHSEPRGVARGEESLSSRRLFPMADDKRSGWGRSALSLKAELDEELISPYRRTVSLPFVMSPRQRAAIKIIDDRGIESMKVMEG